MNNSNLSDCNVNPQKMQLVDYMELSTSISTSDTSNSIVDYARCSECDNIVVTPNISFIDYNSVQLKDDFYE